MNTNRPVTVKILLLFRSAKEIANIIGGVIEQIGVLAQFPHQKDLERFLGTLSANLEILLLANAIDAIRVSFAGEVVEIQLVSPKRGNEQDEIDLSLLEIVPVKTETLHIEMISSSPRLIKAGTIQKIGAAAPRSVTIALSIISVEERINLPTTLDGPQDWLTDVNLPVTGRAGDEDLIDFLS